MKFALPWSMPYGCFPALGGLGLACLITSFQLWKHSLLMSLRNVFEDVNGDDKEKDQKEQVWTWGLGWKGEADEGMCLHHVPNSLVGVSETLAKMLGAAVEYDHKSGDRRVVIIYADLRMPWARLPRAQVPIHRCPQDCWAGPLAALCSQGGGRGTVEPPCLWVQELLFQNVLFEDPHWRVHHLPLQDKALPSQPRKGIRKHP